STSTLACVDIIFFFLILPHPPTSTLFPYTTLFRSAIGLSLPGLIDPSTGTAIYVPYFKWRDLPVVRMISSATGLPVTIDNDANRSEEHTSELQSRGHLVCRLLLEKKKDTNKQQFTT